MTLFDFDGRWTLPYQFEAFKGLQNRQGNYTSKASNNISDGHVSLTINDDTSDSPDPSAEQIAALNFLIQNPDLIRDTLRKAIQANYDELKMQYGYEEGDEDAQLWFPKMNELADFDKIFGVGNVYVQLPSKDGFSYIGLECGCSWDDEHGLGFLLHKNRLVSFGHAEEAFNLKGYEDNGTLEDFLEKRKIKTPPKKYKPHPKYNQLKPSQKAANQNYVWELVLGGYLNLIKEGVETGDIDINGTYQPLDNTMIETAISSKNYEIARYLLDKGAVKGTAIHKAYRNLESIDLLLEYDADINIQDSGGETLIYKLTTSLASLYAHRNQSIKSGWGREEKLTKDIKDLKDYMTALIKRGADVAIENNYHHSALTAARNLPPEQYDEVRAFLLQAGDDY